MEKGKRKRKLNGAMLSLSEDILGLGRLISVGGVLHRTIMAYTE
jgi:hypothetical protein